ncbi:hypothetical protein M885DRAFT_525683 [Pelagophyceae sp. CCMP2097]|nr:hypothetical protein M885DRAFT_525683 [Pelagophyceae sp. CCMP2097]
MSDLAEENARLKARVAELVALRDMERCADAAGPLPRPDCWCGGSGGAARRRLEALRAQVLQLRRLASMQAEALARTDADGAAAEELLEGLVGSLRQVAGLVPASSAAKAASKPSPELPRRRRGDAPRPAEKAAWSKNCDDAPECRAEARGVAAHKLPALWPSLLASLEALKDRAAQNARLRKAAALARIHVDGDAAEFLQKDGPRRLRPRDVAARRLLLAQSEPAATAFGGDRACGDSDWALHLDAAVFATVEDQLAECAALAILAVHEPGRRLAFAAEASRLALALGALGVVVHVPGGGVSGGSDSAERKLASGIKVNHLDSKKRLAAILRRCDARGAALDAAGNGRNAPTNEDGGDDDRTAATRDAAHESSPPKLPRPPPPDEPSPPEGGHLSDTDT